MVESLAQLVLHGREFSSCSSAVKAVHVVVSQSGVTDERTDVHRWFGRSNGRYVFRKRGIAGCVFLAEQIHRSRNITGSLHRGRAGTPIPHGYAGPSHPEH